jgi:hypothetical protein
MESLMPNVAEVIRDHVALTVECVDRAYLNGHPRRLVAAHESQSGPSD